MHTAAGSSGVRGWLGAAAQRGVLLVALLVLGIAALAAGLGALGWWRPALVVPLALLVLAGGAGMTRGLPLARLGTAPTVALLALAAALGLWLQATHSEQVLPRRDSGSNLQAAIALADSGSRIIEVDPVSIGAPASLRIDGITLAAPAFYQTGTAAQPSVQPQFVIGPAAVYSLGRWAGGLETIVVLPAWVSAAAILAIGLLVAITLGGWWGVIAALGVGLAFPIVHTARSTYSEPLALLTLAAGLLAWTLAAQGEQPRERPRDRPGEEHEDRRGATRLALIAGLLIGGTVLMRIDGLREIILVLPVAALGIVQRTRWPRPLLIGLAGGALLAGAAALGLSGRYLSDIRASLLPLLALGGLLGVAAAVVAVCGRRGLRLPTALVPTSLARVLPGLVAGATLIVGILLAARPLFLTVRQDPNDPGARMVAGLQGQQGLPIDGGRTYAEHTVGWLTWWVGPVTLILALFALAGLLAALARRWTRGAGLAPWAGPLVVAAGSTAFTLWRPGITPDHPWAERRLVIAIPLAICLATAATAALWAAAARGAVAAGGVAPGPGANAVPTPGSPGRALRQLPPLAYRAAAALGVAAVLASTAAATWSHRAERVEQGATGPVAAVCRSLHPGDVVLAVDSRAANEWPQVIRGMCRRPALSTTNDIRQDPSRLAAAVTQLAAALPDEARLVLLAADSPDALTALGAEAHQVAAAEIAEDPRLLTRRPHALVPLRIDVWLARR